MKLVGIISDTHFHEPGWPEIPLWIKNAFAGVELILHAGDLETPEVLEELGTLAPTLGVRGNMDSFGTTPLVRVETIENAQIVIAHRLEDAQRRVTDQTNAIIFGHTHIPHLSWERTILCINPGSPSRPRGGSKPSVAVAEISGSSLNVEFKNPP
jgi:hypothetical protein